MGSNNGELCHSLNRGLAVRYDVLTGIIHNSHPQRVTAICEKAALLVVATVVTAL